MAGQLTGHDPNIHSAGCNMTYDIHYIFVESASSSDVTAWVAILISLLALGATLWQGHLSRTHNKLSVRPELEGHSSWQDDLYSLEVRNDGLGPAIIKAARIYYKGNLVNSEGPQAIVDAFQPVEGCELLRHEFFYTPFVLPAGSKISVFTVKYSDKIEDIESYLGGMLCLEIDYESAYKERRPTYKTRQPQG